MLRKILRMVSGRRDDSINVKVPNSQKIQNALSPSEESSYQRVLHLLNVGNFIAAKQIYQKS